MPAMNDRLIVQLETHLEKITEGVFARFFGRHIQAHDIALQLVRALEDGLEPAQDGDTRPLAPDEYVIRLNPTVLDQIDERYPTLHQVLSEQIVELAASAGYRLKHTPRVQLVPAPEIAGTQVMVLALHIHSHHSTTAALQPVPTSTAHPGPANPQLIIEGQRVVRLAQAIIHIGRSTSNDVVIDDAYTSRLHAQIRLRFGQYVIFDTDSHAGTFVNDVRIREHSLRAGDVIRVGRTNIVYMEDDADYSGETDSISLV